MIQTTDVLWPEMVDGVRAGGLKAIETARLTNTNLVIWRDGKIIEITPGEAEAMLAEAEHNLL